jgi:hypothetical protein
VFNTSRPSGTLWSTSTTINNVTWGFILSVYAATDWSADAEMLNLPGGSVATAGVSWIRAPHGSPAARPKLSVFSKASPLHIPAQPGNEYGQFNLLLTAPSLPNGFTLLGETSKVVGVSTMRVASIRAEPGSTAVELRLLGKPGEKVEMSYTKKASMEVTSASVIIGSGGTATLNLK